eukprot:COSAG01_NODE_11827_length_1851_cov_14.312785_4_plen_33_part_01
MLLMLDKIIHSRLKSRVVRRVTPRVSHAYARCT